MIQKRYLYLPLTAFLLAKILWLDSANASLEMEQELLLHPVTSEVIAENLNSVNLNFVENLPNASEKTVAPPPSAPEKTIKNLPSVSKKTTENFPIVSKEAIVAQSVNSELNVNPEPSKIIVPTPNEDTLPELNKPSKTPESGLPIPELEKTPSPSLPTKRPNLTKKAVESAVLNAVTNSSSRYPWFVNPTGDLTISTGSFDPLKSQNYTNLDARFGKAQPIIKQFNFAHFPDEDQFYWILPGNRIVLETQGWQGGISYQGRETETTIEQRIKLTQSFWGMQTVWSIPQAFKDLIGEKDLSNFSILGIAGEVSNPEGTSTSPVIINSGINSNRYDLSSLLPKPPRLGTGSTHSPDGGASLFQYLETENAPLILQGFPTVNLQALLEGEGVFTGAFIPENALRKTGIAWGNPLTGKPAQFQPNITSIPGLKVGQLSKFDNTDLLNILVNPNLSKAERDLYYLNSLFWVSLGQRTPKILQTKTSTESSNWHRFYVSRPHNRTLLQYDSVQSKATYSNVFANPGASFSFSLKQGEVNDSQTLNTSLFFLIGGIFELIHPPALKQSLQEARSRFKRQESASLNTKATADQRRQINQRLNRTLYFANRTGGLEQVSGTLTFPSPITPKRSNVIQIRTGNYQRLVRFYGIDRVFVNGDTYISKLRLSKDKFGPLTFIGTPILRDETSIRSDNQPSNRSSAAQVILESPDGQQYVANFNSGGGSDASDLTVVPINIRSSDLAFDRIELTQVGKGTTRIDSFDGYLFLPTVEAVWAGSSGKWNYAVNSGVWFNLRPDVALNVSSNKLGIAEPSLGMYINTFLNWIDSRVLKDANGIPKAVINHVPSIRLFWNSAANPYNPAYANFSYSYSHQTKGLNYSVTPGLYIANDNRELTPIGFLQGQIALPIGLEFNTSLELGNQFFASLEGNKRLNSVWSVGAYTQNFQSNESLTSRVSGSSYGVIVKYGLRDRNLSWLSRLGMSGDRFEVRLEGRSRF